MNAPNQKLHLLPDYREDPIAPHVAALLTHLGEDVGREGLLETPKRYAKAMRYLTGGYESDVETVVGHGVFQAEDRKSVV